SRWQQRVSLACRVLIVTLLVLALAGLTLLMPTRRQFVVFAVDKSLSVDEESQKKADEYVKKAIETAGPNGVGYLPFAAQPGTFRAGGIGGAKPTDDKGTDLASAIEVAAAATPPFYVPKIVLLSDGNATAGDT